MDSSLITSLIASSVVFSAAFVQGVTGFGAGLISMSLLTLLWSVHHTTLTMVPIGFLMNLLFVWRLRGHWHISDLRALWFGLPFGLASGLWMFEGLPASALKKLLGGLLIGATLYRLYSARASIKRASPQPTRRHAWVGALMGALSGLTSVSLNSPGPPAIVYASLSDWEPQRFRANLSFYFMCCGVASISLMSLRGHLSQESLTQSALLAPALLLGAALGSRLADRLPKALFVRLTLALLLTLGVAFLFF
jgi:uncharacterized protein